MKTIRFTKGTRIYNAGEIATFRDADADHYIKQDGAVECDLDGNPVQKKEAAAPKSDDGTEGYSSKTKQELVALAEERELKVVRRDGQDGEPVKADYVAALEEADQAPAGDQAPNGDDGTEGGEPKGSAEGEGE